MRRQPENGGFLSPGRPAVRHDRRAPTGENPRTPLFAEWPNHFRRHRPRHPPGQGHRHHGAVRHGQDDPAETHQRRVDTGRGRGRSGWPGRPPPRHRRTVPVPHAHGHAVPDRRPPHRPQRVRERGLPPARAHPAARGHGTQTGVDETRSGGSAGSTRPDACGAFGRDGTPRGTGARHRPRPHDDHVRRAVHGAGSHLHGNPRAADPPAQRRGPAQQHRGLP